MLDRIIVANLAVLKRNDIPTHTLQMIALSEHRIPFLVRTGAANRDVWGSLLQSLLIPKKNACLRPDPSAWLRSFAASPSVAWLPMKNAIIDAEVVCLDGEGKSVFLDLMRKRRSLPELIR
jgi:hypothetical protein